MKDLLLLSVGAAFVILYAKRLNKSDRYVSLDNVRRGIRNQWYTAKLATKDGLYYVLLTGTETDGDITSAYYEITKRTFDALQADGVEMEEPANA